MNLEKVKEITKMEDFNKTKSGNRFLFNNDIVVYAGEKSKSCCSGKHKWTNPVIITPVFKNKERVFKEMEVYDLSCTEIRVIDKKHILYNLYNQFWAGGIN